jgi:undecaprenyl-diphosphatase
LFGSLAKRRVQSNEERLAWLLLVSTIPAGLVGVAFESFIESSLGRPLLIALLTIGFGVVMWLVDMRAAQTRHLDGLRWLDALLIGIAQAAALAPGVSRSNITMITARALSVDRESSARYSFLMSIPVIGGAALYKTLEVARDGLPAGTAQPFFWGHGERRALRLRSRVFTLAYLRSHDFRPAVYRFVAGRRSSSSWWPGCDTPAASSREGMPPRYRAPPRPAAAAQAHAPIAPGPGVSARLRPPDRRC